MSLRRGIFGGTFDPIHLGHLLLAETARRLLRLDEVVFVPAKRPPHKERVASTAVQRHRMTDLATADHPSFRVSDIELRRDGPSYTVDTLHGLRALGPDDAQLYLLMGADSARDLPNWRDPEVLLEESTVAVLGRLGVNEADLAPEVRGRLTILDTPRVDISSTTIRCLVQQGESVRYMVTEPVEDYIRSQGLYLS